MNSWQCEDWRHETTFMCCSLSQFADEAMDEFAGLLLVEVDVEIAAWGMAYDDGRTEVVGPGQRLVLSSPERVEAWFSRGAVTAQLVWLGPSTAASLDPGLAA